MRREFGSGRERRQPKGVVQKADTRLQLWVGETPGGLVIGVCRGTLLIRNAFTLRPYGRPTPRAL